MADTKRDPLITRFIGGNHGAWRVLDMAVLVGDALPSVSHLAIAPDGTGTGNGNGNASASASADVDAEGDVSAGPAPAWTLRGATSHARYTTRDERGRLEPAQPPLGRATARQAALIPIRKTAEWWALAQDERREIYDRGQHLAIGMDYLPAVARRLYHSRDLDEPFDFLTWFEFAPEDEAAFSRMLARLRSSEEWYYVDREIDIRLALIA